MPGFVVPHQSQRDTTEHREQSKHSSRNDQREQVDGLGRSQGTCEWATPHDVEPVNDTKEFTRRTANQTLGCCIAAIQFFCLKRLDQKPGQLYKGHDTHPNDDDPRDSPPPLCFGAVVFADRARASVKNATIACGREPFHAIIFITRALAFVWIAAPALEDWHRLETQTRERCG